jgi:acyl-CoA thioester hydrolase
MSEYRYFHPIEVRYGDLDPQDHVNNARYLTFFEQARINYLIHLGLFQRNRSFMDIGIIMADAHVVFKESIRFGEQIKVGMRISKLGNKSMLSEYLIVGSTDREFASGSSTLVIFDYRTRKTMRIPDDWRDKITKFESGE